MRARPQHSSQLFTGGPREDRERTRGPREDQRTERGPREDRERTRGPREDRERTGAVSSSHCHITPAERARVSKLCSLTGCTGSAPHTSCYTGSRALNNSTGSRRSSVSNSAGTPKRTAPTGSSTVEMKAESMSVRCSSMWMLVVGACASVVVGTDCGKECALCVYQLLGQQSAFTSLTCSLECDGGLDSQKLRLCQDVLLEEENRVPPEADARQLQEQEAVSAMTADDEDATSPERQMAKKYGGFMKRYGGFMSRRSSSPEGALEDPGTPEEEESVRLEILKILNAAVEHGGEGEGPGEAAKRYGGFMRRAEGGVAQSNLLEAVLGRGLKKRYGGFMRRVGRPEWLVDGSKSGGVLKRAWESGTELHKRYGGFMD
ncbi:proenkephalin-A-like [Embiotoca jacksoni]|uniref:proenkephalin-A-like n=1 Tax=Embiotoca jacksoni TaxID=100190 RepID=UPI003703E04E